MSVLVVLMSIQKKAPVYDVFVDGTIEEAKEANESIKNFWIFSNMAISIQLLNQSQRYLATI